MANDVDHSKRNTLRLFAGAATMLVPVPAVHAQISDFENAEIDTVRDIYHQLKLGGSVLWLRRFGKEGGEPTVAYEQIVHLSACNTEVRAELQRFFEEAKRNNPYPGTGSEGYNFAVFSKIPETGEVRLSYNSSAKSLLMLEGVAQLNRLAERLSGLTERERCIYAGAEAGLSADV